MLTASDLNSSFLQITNNGEDLAWPATQAKDLDGNQLILSPDGLSTITADTNDQIDFEIGAIDRARLLLDSNGIGQFQVRDLDNTALAGPSLRLLRDSNSPAVDDEIGEIQFVGKDAGGNEETYARIATQIVDPTDTAEDGKITAEALLAGVSTNVLTLDPANNAGLFKGSTVFTADDTYTPPDDLRFVVVEVVGGGGGSGGAAATGAGENADAGGGGGGGYSRKKILASALGATETVTRGAGGVGGATGDNAGATGETTSFGSHLSATGGAGGDGGAATSDDDAANGGSGGIGTGGDINSSGGGGGTGVIISGTRAFNGMGGDSVYGGGQRSVGVSQAGGVFGGGASGASNADSSVARAGADGADGVVIVHEYV